MRPGRTRARTGPLVILLAALLATNTAGVRGDEPAVTTLADFEDNSIAIRITDVENVLAADCDVDLAAIPARGQRSLLLEIGATERNASAACDLRFRLATRFDKADRVATYAWITQGSVDISFRVRDADGRVFETTTMPLKTRNRWVRLVASLSPRELRQVSPPAAAKPTRSKPTSPIQIEGYRIRAHGIGRQAVYLDDLEVEHRASGSGMLLGEFDLDEPTHVYEPGDMVRAAVVLENISRRRAMPLSVWIAWLRSDGSAMATSRAPVKLPASGADYRSRQVVDFSQRIDEPGLYRLVVQVRDPRWASPAILETAIAVTRTNRALPRGRATFFGVQTNLMREPAPDRLLEVEIAREIGVQLLAIELPWGMIEPSRGSFEFDELDELVSIITRRDIAAMLVLTEPPTWLAEGDTDLQQRQTLLFDRLAGRYQKRIGAYQPLRSEATGSGRLNAADLTAAAQILRRVVQMQPEAEVLAPALFVGGTGAAGASLPQMPSGAGVPLVFATSGDSASALAALDTFATENKLTWSRGHRWFHRAEALTGSGARGDAVSVLRHYVRAAREGVGGVVWFDLRDDTNDPRHAHGMRGLVQRDFSPKTPLLGFANTVGMLHGLLYAGRVPGTPPEFESALFIGGRRQVAVFFPKPNRILPAVLAPYRVVEGVLAVSDFDRREQPLMRSLATPLMTTLGEPFFVTLDAQRAQADPQLQLANPWLRVPATVCCGTEGAFKIEIDAPVDLRRSYLQIIVPPGAPLESSVSSRALRARAGDTLSFDVTLTRAAAKILEPIVLDVHLRLERDSLHIPVTVCPLPDVLPLKRAAEISDEKYAIGRLTTPDSDDEEPRARVKLHVGFEEQRLHVAISLPRDAAPDTFLQLGLAVEGADRHAEIRIEHLSDRPDLSPARGTSRSQVRGWRCRRIGEANSDAGFCQVSIPARSLGLSAFQPGTRLLLAARRVEPLTVSWALPTVLEWGRGLGGARSTAGYHWIRLGDTSGQ